MEISSSQFVAMIIFVFLFVPAVGTISASTTSKPVIVAIGDSITYGATGINDSNENSYPEQLSAMVGIPIINQGKNGDTSKGMLLRFSADVISYHPDYVLIMASGNDLPLPEELDIRVINVTSLESNYLQMIKMAVDNGSKVVMINLSPSSPRFYPDPYEAEINDWIGNLTIDNVSKVDIWTPLANSNGTLNLSLSSDGLAHLTWAGYGVVAETVFAEAFNSQPFTEEVSPTIDPTGWFLPVVLIVISATIIAIIYAVHRRNLKR